MCLCLMSWVQQVSLFYCKFSDSLKKPEFSDNLVMSATIFLCCDLRIASMAFLITAMCRNGAALRFDVLRNSSNACGNPLNSEKTELE